MHKNIKKVHLAIGENNNIISASLNPQKVGRALRDGLLTHKVKTVELEYGWQCIRLTEKDIERVAIEIETQALNNDGMILSSAAHQSGVVFPEDIYRMPTGSTIIFERSKFRDCIAAVIEAYDIQYGISLETIRYELLSNDYYKIEIQGV
tara:strand:+ start:946 stop:1395 length:450 start_codon:yes stop_codon:yes gene_type:complete